MGKLSEIKAGACTGTSEAWEADDVPALGRSVTPDEMTAVS